MATARSELGSSGPDVAMMIPNFFGGGAERMMVRMARGLSELGYKVEMVVCTDTGPFRRELGPGVVVVNLRSVHMRRSIVPIVRYLRRRRPTTVLVTLEHMILAVLLARAISGVSVRVVARIATHLSACDRRGLKRGTMSKVFQLLLSRADEVIAVSHGVAEDVVHWAGVSKEKVHPVYNPFVDDQLEYLAGQDAEHPFLKGGDCPVLLAVGRLVAAKDYSTLLRAMEILRTRRTARLVILGEGPERARLERFVRDHRLEEYVSFPGFVDNPFAYMSRASALVLSSIREGLPGVLVQAMACGCPIVSTDCTSGPREILDGGRFGELVPVGDPQELASAIERTLDHPKDSHMLRARAADFSVARAVSRYEQILWPDRS